MKIKSLIKDVLFSLRFDAKFIRTIFFVYMFNLVPNLYSLRLPKMIILRIAGIKVKDAFVRTPLYVNYARNISIGSGVFVNHGVHMEGNAPITIGDKCQIGPFCKFENTNHIADSEEYIEIKLGNNVWIGAGCIILPGTSIDDDAIIGAGAVVKGKISGGGLWAGVPARKIRD